MQIELWWKAPDSSDWFVVKLKRHAPKVTPGGMMSEREIAEYLGVRRGTVFNLLSRAMAKAGQRFIYSDYRIVDYAGRRNAAVATAQLAAEIVLRTSTW